MKIIFVSGGSYKSFYLNYYLKLKKCDLLIFNYGIIYDYVLEDELASDGFITKELVGLSKSLKCTVVAGIYVKKGANFEKSIIKCNHDKVSISSSSEGVIIPYKNSYIKIGDVSCNFRNFHKIVFSDNRIIPNLNHCNSYKFYAFVYKYGVEIIIDKKYQRKFNKYSKIILK